MAFTRTMKLKELEGIINSYCLVTIREAGRRVKHENFMITFSKALAEFSDYTVWFIDPVEDGTLDIVVSEVAP